MIPNKQKRASYLIVLSFFLANLFLLLLLQALQAKPLATANLSGSQKLVDHTTAHPGDSLQYTIIISNNSATFVTASLTDQLPVGLAVESGSLTATVAMTLTESTQLITWAGTLAGNEVVTVSFRAAISAGLSIGESVVNTAVLTSPGQAISLTATTELGNFQLYLPFINRALSTPTLQPIQLICNSDTWTVNWSNSDTGVMYELQEAHNTVFNSPTIYNTANISQPINHSPSPNILYLSGTQHHRYKSQSLV